MTFVIFTPSLALHDAVSTDAYQSFLSLKRAGQDAILFAEVFDPFFKTMIPEPKNVFQLIRDPANTLILHHSTYSRVGEELFDEADCKIVIRYHNITPARFLAKGSDLFSRAIHKRLHQGRMQSYKYGSSLKTTKLVADSQYLESTEFSPIIQT
ncbi:MAG: hypothetical protein WCK17_10065 [Verrucomicrobiota bacterium]